MKITTIILTILAVLAFLTGGVYSYLNHEEFKKINALEERRDKDKNNRIEDNVGLVEVHNQLNSELKDLQESTQEKVDLFAEADGDLKKQQSDNSSLTVNISELAKVNAQSEERLSAFLGIERTVEQIQSKRAKISNLDESIGTSQQALTSKQNTAGLLREKSAQEFKLVNDLRLGGVEAGFSTRVSSTSLQEGFVIISSGYKDNIAAGAKFSLTRGGQQIALGKVSSVSADQAVVTLDPDSTNARVSAGDTAVYVPR